MPPTTVRNRPIREWQDGDTVQGFAFLARKEERQDRNGRTYLDLELRDATSRIVAKAWADSPALASEFESSQFVAFEGAVQKYRDQLQLSVRHCRRADDRDRQHGFDETLLIPTSREPAEELWRRLGEHLAQVERPVLRRLAEETLDAHAEALRFHPAAKSIHHAYRSGLLEHVVSMAGLALRICDHYPGLDRDLIVLGVLFHDLGKILELEASPSNEYTPVGRLVGHVILGRDLLRERCAAIEGFPDDLRLALEHLVLSHQGRKEFGSPVEPMTPEAVALHFIDDLDSKLNQLEAAREIGSGFQFLRPLGRFVYFGAAEEVAAVAAASGEDARVRDAEGSEDDEPVASGVTVQLTVSAGTEASGAPATRGEAAGQAPPQRRLGFDR